MKTRSFFILCLLFLSTQTWSESKWLDYGNGLINLNNVGLITKGVTTEKHFIWGRDRCNNDVSWSYRDWVGSIKGESDYLSKFSTEIFSYEQKLKGMGLSPELQEEYNNEDFWKETGLVKIQDGTPLSHVHKDYSDITSYTTFVNWYTYKNGQPVEDLFKLNEERIDEVVDFDNHEKYYEWVSTVLPVSQDDYKKWLGSSDHENEIIEKTYNLKRDYLEHTVPMYHNSIKFDDFELRVSGTSCGLNLVTSESESVQLIRNIFSKIGRFVDSDKHYMELF